MDRSPAALLTGEERPRPHPRRRRPKPAGAGGEEAATVAGWTQGPEGWGDYGGTAAAEAGRGGCREGGGGGVSTRENVA
jgi:hypothetical protein